MLFRYVRCVLDVGSVQSIRWGCHMWFTSVIRGKDYLDGCELWEETNSSIMDRIENKVW